MVNVKSTMLLLQWLMQIFCEQKAWLFAHVAYCHAWPMGKFNYCQGFAQFVTLGWINISTWNKWQNARSDAVILFSYSSIRASWEYARNTWEICWEYIACMYWVNECMVFEVDQNSQITDTSVKVQQFRWKKNCNCQTLIRHKLLQSTAVD